MADDGKRGKEKNMAKAWQRHGKRIGKVAHAKRAFAILCRLFAMRLPRPRKRTGASIYIVFSCINYHPEVRFWGVPNRKFWVIQNVDSWVSQKIL